jgi:molybdopterin molybdotransferase
MISIKDAIDVIVENTKATTSKIINIEESLGMVVYDDIYSCVELPRFNNSAMDGYGVKLSDVSKSVEVVERVLAGEDKDCQIKESQALKIMTGARVPDSVEAIVPIEDISHDGDNIILPDSIKPNAHIRYSGEDVSMDTKIVSKGDVISSAHIGLLASQGITHIKVYNRVKVAIFSTGKELKQHFESLEGSEIYNSNSQYFMARLKELKCDVSFLGNANDSLESIKDTIKEATSYDIILTSGGASVGDADYTNQAFEEVGLQKLFSKVDIKPGKPVTFGKVKESYVLILPGNPLASALVFEIFGKLLVDKLSGKRKYYQSYMIGKAKRDIKIKKGKNTLLPGGFDGEYFVDSDKKSPGMVAVLNRCNAVVLLDKSVDVIKEGSTLKVMPLYCWSMLSDEYRDIFTYNK